MNRSASLIAHAIEGAPPRPWSPNSAQQRFLWLHSHLVVKWHWHFVGTQLRAYSEHGQTATIWKDDLQELLHRGLMSKGHGEMHELTETGKAFCQ